MSILEIIDGTGHIMGRLATYVAKQALNGEEMVIVNAENIVVTGTRENILADYHHRRNLGVRGRNRKGPYYPRMPDRMFRRSVRGMIPYQEPRGRDAYRRVMAYIGVPKELEGKEFMKLENALERGARSKLSLGEISKNLGAKF